MMHRIYVWETYPEYIATQQYSRCLGRVLVTAILIAQGIAGAHAEDGNDEPMPLEDRAQFREAGLAMIAMSREALELFRANRHGDAASVTAALELLERAEHGLRTRPLPGAHFSGVPRAPIDV
jgi:hypothetical protein